MKSYIDVERVGDNLRTARVKAGYLQADVAELLGVTRQTIIKYENDPGRIDIYRLFDLAKIYGCSVSSFFGG